MVDKKLMEFYISLLSDNELLDASFSVQNDKSFDIDSIIYKIYNYAKEVDDNLGVIFYLPIITIVLLNEITKRFKIYSPHISK